MIHLDYLECIQFSIIPTEFAFGPSSIEGDFDNGHSRSLRILSIHFSLPARSASSNFSILFPIFLSGRVLNPGNPAHPQFAQPTGILEMLNTFPSLGWLQNSITGTPWSICLSSVKSAARRSRRRQSCQAALGDEGQRLEDLYSRMVRHGTMLSLTALQSGGYTPSRWSAGKIGARIRFRPSEILASLLRCGFSANSPAALDSQNKERSKNSVSPGPAERCRLGLRGEEICRKGVLYEN